jgi:hypothetical protein
MYNVKVEEIKTTEKGKKIIELLCTEERDGSVFDHD